MKNIFLLLLLFAINMACCAQRIYICKGHKQNGEPMGQLTTGYWSAKFAGSQMEILCTLDKDKRFKSGLILYFMVEELSENGSYEIVLNSNDFELGPDVYWAVWKNPDINFSGHYRISAMITGGSVTGVITLAVTYFYFDAESTEWNPAKKDDLPFTDYKDAIMIIGKSIDTVEGFIPYNEVGYFTKLKDQNVVTMGFVIRNNHKIIRTKSLHTQFYMEEEGIYQYADSMQFYAMPLRDWAGFYCNFQKAGKYKMKIYNDENVLIKEYDFAIKEF